MKDRVPPGIDILSLEAKDIYMANVYGDRKTGYDPRYSKGCSKGDYNLRRFINTLDYSLDLIRMREVWKEMYSRMKFSFFEGTHEYTTRIINVTFRYSLKDYNKSVNGSYIKLGYRYSDLEFSDSVCIIDGELAGIIVNQEVDNPVDRSLLGNHFEFDGERYISRNNFRTVLSAKQLREYLYENGFICDGNRYVRYKRSAGSARVGKVLFIDERLYKPMMEWSTKGLDIKEGQEIDLAGFEAGLSLTLSSVIDTIEIYPENILLIDDYDSVFREDVVNTYSRDGVLRTKDDNVEISNNIWDGQSLMDVSLFGDYSHYGALLLRHRFFKSCCFNTNIQKWFSDNGITDVSQLNGKTRAKRIEDIKLITTPSSLKYLKFGTFDDWLDNLEPRFGIVKHEKPTHYFDGRMVYTTYQLLNTLQMSRDEVSEFLRDQFDFIDRLKTDPSVLRYFIKYPIENDYSIITPVAYRNDIVYRMLGINEDFTKTKMYADFRDDLVNSLISKMRRGKIFVHGLYATLCGNPIEMLQSAVGKFDGEAYIRKGTVSCRRFRNGEKILGSRNPHVCPSCILLTENTRYELIDEYMNLTKEIVCINTIGENNLQKLSGADFDSDTVMLTNNEYLIRAAERNYDNFKVSVCNADSSKRKRYYTWQDKSDLDIKTGKNKIGEIVNLSARILGQMMDGLNNGKSFEDVMEMNYDVCQLNVLSGIEIDKAKKEYTVDTNMELVAMRNKYMMKDEDDKTIKQYFFKAVDQNKNLYDDNKYNYKKHDILMDYLSEEIDRFRRKKMPKGYRDYIPFYEILSKDDFDSGNVNYQYNSRLRKRIRNYGMEKKKIYSDSNLDNFEKNKLNFEKKSALVDYIGKSAMNEDTMYSLLKSLDKKSHRNDYNLFFEILFSYPNLTFYKLIQKSQKPVSSLKYDRNGDTVLFGYRFSERK